MLWCQGCNLISLKFIDTNIELNITFSELLQVGSRKDSDRHDTGGVTVQATDMNTGNTLVPNTDTDTKEAEITGALAAGPALFPKPGQLLLVKLPPTVSIL